MGNQRRRSYYGPVLEKLVGMAKERGFPVDFVPDPLLGSGSLLVLICIEGSRGHLELNQNVPNHSDYDVTEAVRKKVSKAMVPGEYRANTKSGYLVLEDVVADALQQLSNRRSQGGELKLYVHRPAVPEGLDGLKLEVELVYQIDVGPRGGVKVYEGSDTNRLHPPLRTSYVKIFERALTLIGPPATPKQENYAVAATAQTSAV